jgi:hypothetical protein
LGAYSSEGNNFFTSQALQSDFQQFSGFNYASFPMHIFNPFALNTLRCACSSIPFGQSVQVATCLLTLSCIPAFKSASANYSYELRTSAFLGSVLYSFSEI